MYISEKLERDSRCLKFEPGLYKIASSRTTHVPLYTASFLKHQSFKYLDNLNLLIPYYTPLL